jgi:hypothetical protein
MMSMSRSSRVVLPLAVMLLLASLSASAQRKGAPEWKLAPDDYAAFTIDGMIGVRHLGFFGYDIEPGGRLRSEPKHPAFLSLALVTLLPPGKPRKGAKFSFTHTFTSFEAYTPVKVAGWIRVEDVVGPLLFLQGSFKLLKVRAHGKDPRFYQITRGRLAFSSQFDTGNGVLREAAVKKYEYTYDMRVGLATLYTRQGVKQERGVEASLPHLYMLEGVIAKKEMQSRIDAWVDETAARLLEEWGGAVGGEQYALKPGYDSLYVLALLHAKVPKKNEVIQKVAKRIREAPIRCTYTAALVLMALEALNTPTEELLHPEDYRDKPPVRNLSDDDRRQAERAVRYLVKGQLAGGWTYVTHTADKEFFPNQTGDADNSNTQFALMGLYAARRMGARVESKVWRKALGYWQRVLNKTGFRPKGRKQQLAGWDYNSQGRAAAYLSMTAGGFASLAIISAGLGVKPGSRSKEGMTLGRLMHRALDWLEYFYSVRACRRCRLPTPDLADDMAYQLYALERACDLGRLEKIGRHDWYHDGAMAILNGSYEDLGRDHVVEALSLLFLKRSSPAAVTEPVR